MYKLKNVTAKNFASFTEIECSFDQNLSYLVGKNGEGKSTLGVDILWIVMQGVGQKSTSKGTIPMVAERYQIIGNQGKSAKLTITLHDTKTNKDILVKRKITPDGTELSFEAEPGMNLDQKFLNDLFSEFLINPKRFLQLTPQQQSVALGIDLSEYDKELKGLKENYTLLNRDYRNIGEIVEVPEVQSVDVTALVEEKNKRVAFNEIQIGRTNAIETAKTALDKIKAEHEAMGLSHTELSRIYTTLYQDILPTIEKCQSEGAKIIVPSIKGIFLQIHETLQIYQSKFPEQVGRIDKGNDYIEKLPKPEPLQTIVTLDAEIAEASTINVQASKYQDYLKTIKKKEDLEVELNDNKRKQEKVLKLRTNKIKSFNLPFKDTEINENGELMLKGRYLQEQYFSVGELTVIVPMLIISAMRASGKEVEFPFVYVENFSLLDDDNQQKIVEFFAKNNIQCVCEIVASNPTGKQNEIFLRDSKIVEE